MNSILKRATRATLAVVATLLVAALSILLLTMGGCITQKVSVNSKECQEGELILGKISCYEAVDQE